MSINACIGFISYSVVKIEWLYFICIQLNYMVLGGIFATFPSPCYNAFGQKNGARVYSSILFGSFFASGFSVLCVQFFYEILGVKIIFYIGAFGAIIALIIVMFHQERLDIERLDKRGLIIWGNLKQEK